MGFGRVWLLKAGERFFKGDVPGSAGDLLFNMLARQNRLTKQREFSMVRKMGTFVDGTSVSMGCYDRGDGNPPRFGLVVSTKISKNATKRNYVRRALWEALRQNLYQVKAGYDCVLVAKPVAASKYMSEIMREVPVLLRKAEVTK